MILNKNGSNRSNGMFAKNRPLIYFPIGISEDSNYLYIFKENDAKTCNTSLNTISPLLPLTPSPLQASTTILFLIYTFENNPICFSLQSLLLFGQFRDEFSSL